MQKRKNYLITISGFILLIIAFLPYKSNYTFDRINNQSRAIFKVESRTNFSTTYYSYESIEFLLSIALLVIIFLIARFAKEPFKNIVVILMTLAFYFGMLYVYIMSKIGNYDLLISFYISFITSTFLIVKNVKHALAH